MSPSRAPRADARRNRQRVLDTAKDVFAAEGSSAGLLDIATRAGVGAGTVYRHFPTKEALYAAVATARISDLLDRVPELPDDPPGSRCRAFWFLAVEQARANVDLCELVTTTTGRAMSLDPAVRRRFLSTLDELVDSAHVAGRLDPALSATDLAALLSAAAMAEARPHDARPGQLSELIAGSIFR